MSDNDQYLLIIPNAIIPYGYELTKIMAYPIGFQYRFRFDEKYVDDEVKTKISNLCGKKGLIVIRDKEEARFYPIRYFNLTLARRIGKIFYFEYELGEFIDFSSDENYKSHQLIEFNDKFNEFHKGKFVSNEPGQDMKPLVILNGFKPNIKNEHYVATDKIERDFEQWGNIVTLTKNINFYEGVEFIKLIEADPLKSDGTKSYFRNSFLYVREGEDYKLPILQLVPNKGDHKLLEPRDIEVKSDNKYIEVLRDKARAVGKYDVLTFIFRVKSHSGGKDSFLDVLHTPKSETMQYIEPKYYIPIRIERSYAKLFIKLGIAIVFVVGYGFVHLHPQASIGIMKDISLIGVTIITYELLREIRGFFGRN